MKRILLTIMTYVLTVGIVACGGTDKFDESSLESSILQENSMSEENNSDSVFDSDSMTEIVDEHPYVGTKKVALNPTTETILIDGEKDVAYNSCATKIVLEEINEFYWANAPYAFAPNAWITYDQDFLYVFVEIDDFYIDNINDTVWRKDCIGVIVDFSYTRDKVAYTGALLNQIGYANISCDNQIELYHMYTENAYKDRITYHANVDEHNGQWTLEMKLPLKDGFSGTSVGFELLLNDAINGDRYGVYTWNVDGSQMYKYTHVTGTLDFAINLWE